MKRVTDILKDVSFKEIIGKKDNFISTLSIRLNEVKENSLYFVIKGSNFDGIKNVNDAYNKGAKVFVSDRVFKIKEDSTLIIVEEPRDALYKISKNFYDDPSSKLNVFGVTGSSGKTTVINLLRKIFPNSGSIGSEGVVFLDNKIFESTDTLTTPESHIINYYLNESIKYNIKNFFIESSSFSLRDKRIYGIDFKGGIFLNFSITHHLKIHRTVKDYLQNKLKLKDLVKGPFLLNFDDPYTSFFKKDEKNYYFSYKERADFYIEKVYRENDFYLFKLNLLGENFDLKLKDKEDIYPLLPSLSLAYLFDINIDEIINNIDKLIEKPEGRWEIINIDPLIVVDKSNTPLSIKFLIDKIKKLNLKRKIVIFSFFEEEDIRETILITKLLVDNFDLILVTQDDSKEKTPFQCNKNFLRLLKEYNAKYLFIEDRKECIKRGIEFTKKFDGLFILGRGNEKMMKIYKDRIIPFNDIEITKEIFNEINSLKLKNKEKNLWKFSFSLLSH